MKYINYIGILVFSLMMLFASAEVKAVNECCPSPPYCVPTMACPIQMSGGQTASFTNKVIQWVTTGYETTTQWIRTAKKGITKVRRTVTAGIDGVTSAIGSVITYPFKKAGQWLGLLKTEEDQDNVTQDNSHGDLSVEKRMENDLKTHEIEMKSDYESEYFTVERRKYIRQQSTITLMARMLVMKSHLPDIKKIMDSLDEEAKKNEKKASKEEMDESMNQAVILGGNQELRMAWFQLLTYQKMIEAVKLEFAANQSISGMKVVKHVPQIKSDQKTGGGSVEAGK